MGIVVDLRGIYTVRCSKVRDGTRFDVATSSLIFVGYAVPGFLFAIFLLVIFAGGGYFEIFPLGVLSPRIGRV